MWIRIILSIISPPTNCRINVAVICRAALRIRITCRNLQSLLFIYSHVEFIPRYSVSEQCGIAASNGNQIIGLIRRKIAYKEKRLIIPVYKAIVRPHLEYCIQAWRPYRKKDTDTPERIQRRATKMISELRDLSYERVCFNNPRDKVVKRRSN